MLRRTDQIRGAVARRRVAMDQAVTSQDSDHTQRGIATGIVAELETEGYHDAEPVGRGGFGVV